MRTWKQKFTLLVCIISPHQFCSSLVSGYCGLSHCFYQNIYKARSFLCWCANSGSTLFAIVPPQKLEYRFCISWSKGVPLQIGPFVFIKNYFYVLVHSFFFSLSLCLALSLCIFSLHPLSLFLSVCISFHCGPIYLRLETLNGLFTFSTE